MPTYSVADHAEDDRDDAADEDVEEVVDARPAAPQAIEALQVEGERHDHRDERQDVEVLRERRLPLRCRDEAGLEANEIREDERHHAQQGVGDDVERNQQPVVAPYHRCPAGAAMVSSTTCMTSAAKRSRLKRSACRRMRSRIPRRRRRPVHARRRAPLRRRLDEHAGFAVDDGLERAAAAERDHRPAAGLRLERHDAEVLLAGQQRGDRRAVEIANLFVRAPAEELRRRRRRTLRAAPARARRRRWSAAPARAGRPSMARSTRL